MKFDKILKLLSKLKGDEADLYNYMLHSFVQEIVDFKTFNEHDLLPYDLGLLLDNVAEDIDPYVADQLFASAVEFVITNYYPMPEQKKGLWNCINYLLDKRKLLIKPEEAAYLKGLRDSYMSLYEVQSVNPGSSITLRSMIEEDQPVIIVKEKLGSTQICKYDILGVRVVKSNKSFILSGVILQFDRKAAEDVLERIKFMTDLMNQHEELKSEVTSQGVTDEEFYLLNKKLWAKEIIEDWFLNLEEKANNRSSNRNFLNYEGDPLKFSTVEFKLAAPQKQIEKMLDNLEDFSRAEGKRGVKKWIWLDNREINTNLKQKDNESQSDLMRIDTQAVSNLDSSITKRIFADVELTKDKLTISVNSTQRAYIACDMIENILESLVKNAVIAEDKGFDEESNVNPTKLLEIDPKMDLDLEQIRHKFLEDHYKTWPDIPIPALSNKAPRDAVKTKSGRSTVINLIKDMINTEIRANKRDSKHKIYEFDGLIASLGIKSSELETVENA